ncbi:MAG: metalloprotease [Desulfurococcales archaeon]|nr:metalloprotease [Desulfurococcales archaeon]
MYGYRARPSLLGREYGEPLSWILGIAAITLAIGGSRVLNPYFYLSGYFGGILVGFVGHELAHRQIAKRYGMAAEFIAFTPGLLITVISAFIPFIVILAPGYVRTISYFGSSYRGVLNSVAGGPAVNLALAMLGFAAHLITGSRWIYTFAQVNTWIGLFNLLPIPPLDGEKIFRLNPQIWIAMFLIAVALYIVF